MAVLASGEGSTFEALVHSIQNQGLPIEVVLLLTDKPKAGVIQRAEGLGVDIAVRPLSEFSHREAWDQSLEEALKGSGAQVVVLAGFLKLLGPKVLASYKGRIVNTHPSLLPKFGGAGMYGRRVHQAVIDSGESHTGVSLHLVTDQYDEGPVIAQVSLPVLGGETAEELEVRVKRLEKEFLAPSLCRWLQTVTL
jgi:phosphoribosylglycinamide formyltransferase-1